jgi:hypothetical protein
MRRRFGPLHLVTRPRSRVGMCSHVVHSRRCWPSPARLRYRVCHKPAPGVHVRPTREASVELRRRQTLHVALTTLRGGSAAGAARTAWILAQTEQKPAAPLGPVTVASSEQAGVTRRARVLAASRRKPTHVIARGARAYPRGNSSRRGLPVQPTWCSRFGAGAGQDSAPMRECR